MWCDEGEGALNSVKEVEVSEVVVEIAIENFDGKGLDHGGEGRSKAEQVCLEGWAVGNKVWKVDTRVEMKFANAGENFVFLRT